MQVLLPLVALLLLAPAGWILYHRAPRSRKATPADSQEKSVDQLGVTVAVNQALSEARTLPPAELVLGSASLVKRDGQLFLSGAVENRSTRVYSRVHLTFYASDEEGNRAGVLEADVSNLQPHKETTFEIGPAKPEVHAVILQSLQAVR